nr:FGGY family carbohydrate kinase [Candidatus Njordarchaeota archaeon]
MPNECLLGIDFGTSGGKCLIADFKGNQLSGAFKQWWYVTPEELKPYGKEFKPDQFWQFISDAIKEALRKAKIPGSKVVGVSTSSLRQGIVLLDENGKELYAGPNIDARGALAQDRILETLGEPGLFQITGQCPVVICAPSRLLWFKENKPEIYSKVKHLLMISDWIVYRLSGAYASELSCASSSMWLDLKKADWSTKISEELELPHEILPNLYSSGQKVGEVTKQASKETGLAEGTPVVMGGADSQLGLLGTGSVEPYDTTVIGGTTSMLQTVLSKPIIDPQRRILTSCHVIKDQWVLEANAGMTGKVYNWLRDSLNKVRGGEKKTHELDYEEMDELAARVPPGSEDMFAFLGSEVMDLKKIDVIRPGVFLFPPPANPIVTTPIDGRHMIRAVIEMMAYAIHGNRLTIEEVLKRELELIRATGGLSKGKIWVQIISDVSGKPVETFKVKEGSLMGCAICAATGINEYKSLQEAAKNMVQLESRTEPDREKYDTYVNYYARWRELYDKIVGL